VTDPIVIKPRAAPLSTGSGQNSDAHRDPEVQQSADAEAPRSSPEGSFPRGIALGIGGIAILGALYWVFLVLPDRIATPELSNREALPAESTQETTNKASTVAPESSAQPPVTPFHDAQLARAKQQAEQELAGFVELQIELEEQLQINAWGRAKYDAVKDLATRGDTQFVEREFAAALDTYRAATLGLRELRTLGEAEYAAGMDAGNTALADFNQLLAQREFEQALRVKADDAAALAGLARAKQLPEIQTLLRKARQLARRGDTQAATDTYQQIMSIDPLTASVPEALADLATATTAANYTDHLSTGFAALEAGRHAAARSAFNAALAIRPNDAVAKGGLQQIAQETEVKSLQGLQGSAEAAANAERWEDAVAAYDKALATDPNLAFAQGGRRDAKERLRLMKGMNIIVAQAEKLSDNARMQEAVALLQDATALPSAGPQWSSALAKAENTVKAYQRPVPVRLISDNATRVTVYKVGRLGMFETHDLQLRPGSYTIVGSADGCQDIRKEIIVKPQMPPVVIRCENRLR